jgi:hypothetical protein
VFGDLNLGICISGQNERFHIHVAERSTDQYLSCFESKRQAEVLGQCLKGFAACTKHPRGFQRSSVDCPREFEVCRILDLKLFPSPGEILATNIWPALLPKVTLINRRLDAYCKCPQPELKPEQDARKSEKDGFLQESMEAASRWQMAYSHYSSKNFLCFEGRRQLQEKPKPKVKVRISCWLTPCPELEEVRAEYFGYNWKLNVREQAVNLQEPEKKKRPLGLSFWGRDESPGSMARFVPWKIRTDFVPAS